MLTLKELEQRAPAAFTRRPAGHCSNKYVMLPTIDAIEALQGEGYVVVDAKQSTRGVDRFTGLHHQQHSVTLRPASAPPMTKKQLALGVVQELHLINSSDASAQFAMERGVFRQVCSNGLIVFRREDGIAALHRHIDAAEVIARARRLAAESSHVMKRIEEWARRPISDAQAAEFAARALLLRMGAAAKNYDPRALLEVKREEDAEQTLWNVLNRIQEHGMRGGFHGASVVEGREAARVVTARPLTALDSSLQFNRELWRLAEEIAA